MTAAELRERVAVAWQVLHGRPLIWRTDVRWESGNVIRIRPTDSTANLLVKDNCFDPNPDSGDAVAFAFGDGLRVS